jgi:hypothetical protein
MHLLASVNYLIASVLKSGYIIFEVGTQLLVFQTKRRVSPT